MQWIKIQINDKAQSGRAMMEMARRGRIDCYEDEIYMVPEPALQLLDEMGITYRELGRGAMDYAEKTLRDTLASSGKRRPPNKSRKASADE